jgi:Na+/melibiose symporter-like transporter
MAGVLFEIADHAYLPVIVPSGHLVAANSKRETVDALAEITGPPLGGALVQWLTAPFALAIDACSFVVSALLIGRIREREPIHERQDSAQQAASLLREAREGRRVGVASSPLRPLFLSTTLLTFFMSFMASLYTLFALQTLRLSPGVLGLVIGCGGIGALAGAASTPALVRWIGSGRTALAALLLGGFAHVHSTRAGGTRSRLAFLIASQLLGDGLLTIYLITETSLRHRPSRRKRWAVPRRCGRWLPASLRRSA